MISLEKLGYFLPQGYLFAEVSLQINRGDKIGLVGKNGAGKSTLLRLLTGQTTPSEGKIHFPKNCRYGFLSQDIKIETELSVFSYLEQSNDQFTQLKTRLEEINNELTLRTDYESESYLNLLNELSECNEAFQIHEGYHWEEKIMNTLEGLGFAKDHVHRPLNTFSGGWKMRAELARILVNDPDVLLLDEPTNHLDILSIAWLENYLQRFLGSVILISHDRLFLDNITKRTLEISMGKIIDYPFGYSRYKERRAEESERLEGAKKQQDKAIKQTEMLIEKFRAKQSKAAFAQSLIKKLDRTERIEIENDQYSGMRVRFPLSVQPGKWVLNMEGVGKTYERPLFRSVSITVGRGEKIALLGPNGIGKSSLLKVIMKAIDYEGSVAYGHNVGIGYFAQNQAEQLDPNQTIFEAVDQVAKGDIRLQIRSLLGTFLFSGEDIHKKVGILSGGERTRLALCQMLLSPSNFLILDEPTNHLDIPSKEILKNALVNYEGTFIIVSHDREFLSGLTNRIWDIENQGLTIHHFELDEYLRHKAPKVDHHSVQKNTESPSNAAPKTDQAGRERKNKLQKTERLIEETEGKLSELEKQLVETQYHESNYNALISEYHSLKNKLDQLMDQWETLV
ncbi:MAG: ABC-F family ATP-binding cassette domain-containing protein [Bacteroidetes bacterium]|nr:ABC-F family ATP-binding cassette domain-containing protein [Bacteroidota bacterium]MBM3425053.1 ABC-F family ATP-binding cassette domain-containing protein [Bacteroidota bacterium]